MGKQGVCRHERCKADVRVSRALNTNGVMAYGAETRIGCEDCGVLFQFIGAAPTGRDRTVLLSRMVPVVTGAEG